ncbi:MAG: [Fe-Fe] hydrogenase large subunit C-terminal domain-containing protein [Thermoanaerobacteraceae bacterium]|nr:[Fe-Fe] hydrogenase large subunit C-terminal domain-containing protein [Thermoanaerobacteraceae bacterium]
MALHSVVLNEAKCKGCTNCIKHCPTEAIRVRNGKARIIEDRCIDCGECIRVCPNHAKEALMTPLSEINRFRYKIALPAPSFYGQFKQPIEIVLGSLLNIGFDYIYEVASAAELTSRYINKYLKDENIKRPAISSSCPSVVRLIMLEFPGLIDNIIRVESPMEIAARIVKKHFSKKLSISEGEIGVFFISPCAAKMTAVKNPIGTEKSSVDGVISMQDLAPYVLKTDKTNEFKIQSSTEGIGWAISGGESKAAQIENSLYVDGIHNCIEVLREIELGKLNDIEFFEGLACPGGCIGGPLTVENLYVSKNRIKKLMDSIPECKHTPEILEIANPDLFRMEKEIGSTSSLTLDEDIGKAIEKLTMIDQIVPTLPGLDCGACGAPTCKALAEDIVRGWASEMDCIFILKKKISTLAKEVAEISTKLPPTLHEEGGNSSEG